MPRDGSGVYTRPFPDVAAGTPIESAVYNGFTNDVALDLNAPRPIVAGGTGASNATQAMLNLKGEIAVQVVTNYDTFTFASGSFYSAPGATAAPDGVSSFTGICYTYATDGGYMTLEARAFTAAAVGPLYVRQKKAGVWGAWAQQSGSIADTDALYVKKAGDTMTGDLTLLKATPTLNFDKGASGQASFIIAKMGGVLRWRMQLSNSVAESGGNAGSDFGLQAFSDAGALVGQALTINRATALMTLFGDPTVGLGAATKQYTDSTAAAVAGATVQNSAVRYDFGQTLTAPQKKQVQANTGLNKGYFHVNRNGVNQAASGGGSGALSRIDFNNELVDSASWFDPATFRYTPQEPGWYYFYLSVATLPGTGAETCQATIRKNGATVALGNFLGVAGIGGNSFFSNGCAMVSLNGTTDFVDGATWLPAGTATINGAIDRTFMFGWKIGEL